MSVSSIGSSASAAYISPAQAQQPVAKAADGDSPAVEAKETASTRQAETQGGGVAPQSTTGFNKLV
jgi:hypothetical protein